jgi:putative ABC transport system substrate-binding protein
MRRRDVVSLLGGAAFVWPLAALGEQPAIPLIAVLSAEASDEPCVAELRRGLAELGYVEGQTYLLEPRFAEGQDELLPTLATELVRLRPAVLVVSSGTAVEDRGEGDHGDSCRDDVELLPDRDGGHSEPLPSWPQRYRCDARHRELMQKRVQLLHEMAPMASCIAVLRLPGHLQDLVVTDMVAAAPTLGVQLRAFEVRRPDELSTIFDAAIEWGAQAVISTQGPFFHDNRVRIAELALEHRLPSLSGEPDAAQAGALMFYGRMYKAANVR